MQTHITGVALAAIVLLCPCAADTQAAPIELQRGVVNPSPDSNDLFGQSVSLSGGIALVGASLDGTTGSGSGQAYPFNAATGALLHSPSTRRRTRTTISASASPCRARKRSSAHSRRRGRVQRGRGVSVRSGGTLVSTLLTGVLLCADRGARGPGALGAGCLRRRPRRPDSDEAETGRRGLAADVDSRLTPPLVVVEFAAENCARAARWPAGVLFCRSPTMRTPAARVLAVGSQPPSRADAP